MPELPEVETIRIQLKQYLVGHVIEDVEVRLPKQISGEVQRVIGAKVQGVRRFGKGLVIDLDNSYSLTIHIKMTGQLVYRGPDLPKTTKLSQKVGGLPGKATHVIFKLKSQKLNLKNTDKKSKVLNTQDAYLYYNDVRQFGWIKIVKTEDVFKLQFFKTLGPEFLRDLELKKFQEILKSKKTSIKPLVMDQAYMAGVGNIYANDALYVAKIHPRRPANSLTEKESKDLFAAIEEVLKKGIKAGGSSEWAYVNALGEEGNYQKTFLVYGKVGKKCERCGTIIEKITLGGRGTFFCPACQI